MELLAGVTGDPDSEEDELSKDKEPLSSSIICDKLLAALKIIEFNPIST